MTKLGNDNKEGFKETLIGQLPSQWRVLFLDEIAEVTMGQSPDSKYYNVVGEGLPLIQGNADCKNGTTQPRFWTTQITKTCDPGDLILSVRAPVGPVAKSSHHACIGRGVCAIKPAQSSNYLFHILISLENKWGKISQGSTFDAVTSSQVKKLRIAVPPIKEQEKITAIISVWDRAIERVQRLIEAKQRQKKGLMQGLLTGRLRFPEFGEPVKSENDIPIGWKNNRLRELVTFHNGFGFPEQDQGNSVGDIPFIKVSDMLNTGNHKFIFASNNYVSSETMKLKGWKTAPASAIIFAKVGEALYKNRRRILAQDTIIDNNVMAIKAIPQKIDDNYLYYVMLLVNFSKIAFPGALPSVNQTELGNVHVILPGLSEQRKIIAILDRTDAEIDLINKKLALLQQQKKGLMQKLLTGEIRVKVD